MELLKNLVREYYGYTLLPYLSILGMSSHEKKRIKKLITPTPQRSVNLTARKNNARTKVIQFLKEEIVANLPKVEGISLKE